MYLPRMSIEKENQTKKLKMFNQDEGKIECAVGNRDMCFWQGKKAEIVLILFLMSGFAVLFVSGSLYQQIQTTRLNHVLSA